MSLTSAQQAAVVARGNVLVVAGAGTGKTSALVERCLNCLLTEQPRVSLDEILMVTFTEAAAADMRRRIRDRLEEEERNLKLQYSNFREASKLNNQSGAGGSEEISQHLREQLALFETAHIGTLHSFCFQLVRQHFYELGLDPQMTVMAEEEARLLAEETLNGMLKEHYAGRTKMAAAVQDLIEVQGDGRDQAIRALVIRLHHYSQTRPDPAGWLQGQLGIFADARPTLWERWLVEALEEWRERWLPVLEKLEQENGIARVCAAALRQFKKATKKAVDTAAVLDAIRAAAENCPHGKKTAWRDPLSKFLEEAEFLASLLTGEEGETRSPLEQDWDWVRGQMTTLLELAREFEGKFSEAKRELGVVDFHDLEQHALRLLWNSEANQPTRVAAKWRKQFRFVFVDEYQDINAAQDKIIEALSREHAQANRFLVGDVKQSIYRFRLADPSIFQRYAQGWRVSGGQVIPLVENFRSREGILDFVNSLFSTVMRREVGGVDYDDEAKLRFGAREQRQALSTAAGAGQRVELGIRFKGGRKANGEESNENLAGLSDMEEADKEARAVAVRLMELKARKEPVWDEETKAFRPVEWSDIAILLRSPANKSERYAKEFARLNVPLQVARGGFYESLEISDLLSLLAVLDNPLQDVPLLAVLHSPLTGLTVDELATVRLMSRGPYWTALVRAAESLGAEVGGQKSEGRGQRAEVRGQRAEVRGQRAEGRGEREEGRGQREEGRGQKAEGPNPGLEGKVRAFLDRYSRWRKLARQGSLSRCLETVLSETHYGEWLRSQPGGAQRYANVQRLLRLAKTFDQFQRQGLFRFLKFVEAQRSAESEPEVAPVTEQNAVRLMSIHQSKGLEFPVVVVADLGKPFNVSDLRADIILDDKYGLCPQILAPESGSRYPSLPHWLASRRQHREMLGEELRLLYVAMTRARDTLLLSASLSESRFEKVWQQSEAGGELSLADATSYADWLGMWFSRNCAAEPEGRDGENELLRWKIHDDAQGAGPDSSAQRSEMPPQVEPKSLETVLKRLAWEYPYLEATRQAAKIRVSEFSRRAAERPDEEAMAVEGLKSEVWSLKSGGRGQKEEDRGQRSEVRGQRGERTGEKTEGRSQRSEVRGQKSEGRGRRAEISAAEIGSAHHTFLEFVRLEKVGSVKELRAEAKRFEELGVLRPEEIPELDIEGLAAFWTSALGQEILANAAHVRRELAFTTRFSPEELAAVSAGVGLAGMKGELIVTEGKADLVVVLPKEIRLVDFKTDRITSAELAERSKFYAPQVRLYAQALTQIYGRPVTECWLYFLKPREAVRVKREV